jgi:hypothetical protein
MLFLISAGRPVSFAILAVQLAEWLICLSARGCAANGLEIEEEGGNVTAGSRVAPQRRIIEQVE